MAAESGAEAEHPLAGRGVSVFPRYIGFMLVMIPFHLLFIGMASVVVTAAFILSGDIMGVFAVLAAFGYAVITSHYLIVDERQPEPEEFGPIATAAKTVLVIAYYHAAIFIAVVVSTLIHFAGYPDLALVAALWYPGWELATARRNIPLNLLVVYTVLDWIVEAAARRSRAFSLQELFDRYQEAADTISHLTLQFSPPRRPSTN